MSSFLHSLVAANKVLWTPSDATPWVWIFWAPSASSWRWKFESKHAHVHHHSHDVHSFSSPVNAEQLRLPGFFRLLSLVNCCGLLSRILMEFFCFLTFVLVLPLNPYIRSIYFWSIVMSIRFSL
jgi:hypothetical protein